MGLLSGGCPLLLSAVRDGGEDLSVRMAEMRALGVEPDCAPHTHTLY